MAFDTKEISTIIKHLKAKKEAKRPITDDESVQALFSAINAWNGTHHKNPLSFFTPYESATEFGIHNVVNPALLTTASALTAVAFAAGSVFFVAGSIWDAGHLNIKSSLSCLKASIGLALVSLAIAAILTPAIIIGFAVSLITRTLATAQEAMVNLYKAIIHSSADEVLLDASGIVDGFEEFEELDEDNTSSHTI